MRFYTIWFMTLLLSIGLMTGCGDDNAAAQAETIAPTVTASNPAEGAVDVAINNNIAITFSEAMNPLTITGSTLTLQQGATNITGIVSVSGNIATFNPDSNLIASTAYLATVTTGAKDLTGNALAAAFTLNFTTGTAEDSTVPTIVSISPVEAVSNATLNGNVVITFSENMDPLTITGSTFTLQQGATNITGIVSVSGNIATFNPDSNLIASTAYLATVTTGAKDLAGNALAAAFTLNFTTGTAVALGPVPVDLGTAGNYVILAKTAISKTLTVGTAITGSIGISPAAATYITEFSLILPAASPYSTSIYVTEFVYAPGYANPTPSNLTTAISNMEAAYTDAAGRSLPDGLNLGSAGEIGGLTTLVPGLYKYTTGVTISTDLTLTGGANDVWIFQIAENFLMASGVQITLAGGAQPKNIFWQVAGNATMETTTVFKGIMLCKTGITLKTGASANGRLLAQTAVVLDANAVTKPAE